MIKFINKKGSITIEASLVFFVFIVAYIALNNLAIGLLTESLTRKALYETGLDISSYVMLSDRINQTNLLQSQEIDNDEYIKVFEEMLLDESVEGEDLLQLIKDKMLGDGGKYLKNKSLEVFVNRIFEQKIENLGNYEVLDKLGLVDGLDGIKFEEVSILESEGDISLSITYDFALDKFNYFNLKYPVRQNFHTNLSLNSDNENEYFSSIWNRSNFERGKYFANEVRSSEGTPIKPGQGVDFIDQNGYIVQVFSLNIFKSSYSEESADRYIIHQGFFEQVKGYYMEMIENVESIDKVTLEDESIVSIDKNKRKILIILPEESPQMTNINDIQNELTSIVNIEIIYKEKVFSD